MEIDDNFLQQILIFDECTLKEKKRVLSYFNQLKFKKDEIIFSQGDIGKSFYIVIQGTVGSFTTLSDGSKLELARFSKGKSFGEMSLAEDSLYSTTCYSFTDTELFIIDITDFYHVFWKHPEIGVKVIKAMIRDMIANLKEADQFLMAMAMWGEKARLRAITDEMTGLYNKRFFEELLHLQISKSRHNKARFSLLMFDLDHLHQINIDYGFEGGDKLIKSAADALKAVFKHNAIISRLGGDEFAILMPGTRLDDALKTANEIKKILSEKSVLLESMGKSEKVAISMSIGIAQYPEHGDGAESLKISADKALYSAKKTGRNRITVFDPRTC
jgi:diguanylate cyclase (GGDEF)-like protein